MVRNGGSAGGTALSEEDERAMGGERLSSSVRRRSCRSGRWDIS